MIFLGTIVKNYEAHFSVFQSFIHNMIEKLPQLCICIYEDNSTDRTPLLLQELQSMYKNHIHLLCERFESSSMVRAWNGTPCRIESIASARNQLMNMLEKKGMGTNVYDVCIIIDSDFKQNPSIESIESIVYWATHFPEDVDALFANGQDADHQYYDIFAYRDNKFPFDYDIYGEKDHTDLLSMKTESCKHLSHRKERTPVYSAFGGVGIYRAASIRQIRYSFVPTKALDTFYRSMLESTPNYMVSKIIRKQQESPGTHYHGALLGSKWFDSLFYYHCWGYNVPVVCEHITFHMDMIQKGYNRLFIEPTLLYHWS